MPLTELDPNISGRNRRASNVSASSKDGLKDSGRGLSSEASKLPTAPGVLSMLRTSTELGNIGAPGTRSGRFLAASDYRQQRRSHATLLSHSSSQRSHVSRSSSTRSGREPSVRSIRTAPNRQGLVNPQSDRLSSMPPMGLPRATPRGTNGHSRNGRSFTMTQAESRIPHPLPNHRSLTSLRNHGPTPRPRSPFMYPTRLKRPGYRPSSPATSDVTGSQYSRSQYAHSDKRASSASPFIQQEPHQFSYRQGPNRSAPTLPIRYHTANLVRKQEYSPPVSYPSSSSSSMQRGEIPPAVIIHQQTTIVQSLGAAVPSSEPRYYDYSEQFEKVHTVNQQDVVQASEDELARLHTAGLLQLDDAGEELPVIAELPASDVAELPPSPVVRRLTRELVKAAIDVTSDEPSECEDHKTAIASESNEARNVSSPPTPEPAEARMDLRTSSPEAPVPQDASVSGPTTASTASDASHPASASVRDFASSSPVPVSVLSNGSVTETASSSEQSNVITDSPATSTGSGSRVLKSTSPMLNGPIQLKTPSHSLRRRSATVGVPAVSNIGTLTASSPVTRPISGHGSVTCHMPSHAAQREAVADAVLVPLQNSGSEHVSKPDIGEAPLQQRAAGLSTYGREHSTRPDSAVNSLHSLESQTEDAGPRGSHATTDLLQNARKTFARHLSALEDMRNAARLSQDTTSSGNSTTDLRFSTLRYPVTHLSDLKEESQEDISSTNLRSLGYNFRLPKPGALRVSGDSTTRPNESSTADRLGLIEMSRPLGEVRNLPSLNFSRLDLFTKLNDALNTRSSFAGESKGESRVPSLYAPVPERMASSLLLADRYNSFFVKDQNSTTTECNEEPGAADCAVNVPERPLSAADIEIIKEVNRLSVPSVSGLTQRLSELLPSLKRYDADGLELLEGHAEHSASASERPTTLASARASSEFRALAAAADMVAMSRSSHVKSEYLTNKIAEDVEALGLMKALPALPDESNELNSTLTASSPRAGPTVTSLDDVCKRLSIAELEAPLPAKLRGSWNAQGGDAISAGQNGKVYESSNTGSRPWNLDESYPWSDTAPTIEVTIPAQTHRRSTSEIIRSKLRRSQSASELPRGDTSLSPRSPTVVSDTACLGGSHEKRKNSKRSILGSISRKMRLRREAFDRSGFPTGPDLLRPGDTRSFEPGDRYPTSGLTPPAAFNLEEVRSFFSDDSERTERAGSFRKRLTALKRNRPGPSRTLSRQAGDEFMGSIDDEGASFDRDWATYPGVARPRDYAVGMGKMEFRARKVVERIKSILFKSGELLRSMSGKKKAGHHAWDRESDLYSGT